MTEENSQPEFFRMQTTESNKRKKPMHTGKEALRNAKKTMGLKRIATGASTLSAEDPIFADLPPLSPPPVSEKKFQKSNSIAAATTTDVVDLMDASSSEEEEDSVPLVSKFQQKLEKLKEREYCICRQLDSGEDFMIHCETCDEWYHGNCIGIEEDGPDAQADEWECLICKGGSYQLPKEKRAKSASTPTTKRSRSGKRKKRSARTVNEEPSPVSRPSIPIEKVRSNARASLENIFSVRVSGLVEEALFKLDPSVGKLYRFKARDLVANFVDGKNKELVSSVENFKVPFEELVNMSYEELAPRDVADERRRTRETLLKLKTTQKPVMQKFVLDKKSTMGRTSSAVSDASNPDLSQDSKIDKSLQRELGPDEERNIVDGDKTRADLLAGWNEEEEAKELPNLYQFGEERRALLQQSVHQDTANVDDEDDMPLFSTDQGEEEVDEEGVDDSAKRSRRRRRRRHSESPSATRSARKRLSIIDARAHGGSRTPPPEDVFGLDSPPLSPSVEQYVREKSLARSRGFSNDVVERNGGTPLPLFSQPRSPTPTPCPTPANVTHSTRNHYAEVLWQTHMTDGEKVWPSFRLRATQLSGTPIAGVPWASETIPRGRIDPKSVRKYIDEILTCSSSRTVLLLGIEPSDVEGRTQFDTFIRYLKSKKRCSYIRNKKPLAYELYLCPHLDDSALSPDWISRNFGTDVSSLQSFGLIIVHKKDLTPFAYTPPSVTALVNSLNNVTATTSSHPHSSSSFANDSGFGQSQYSPPTVRSDKEMDGSWGIPPVRNGDISHAHSHYGEMPPLEEPPRGPYSREPYNDADPRSPVGNNNYDSHNRPDGDRRIPNEPQIRIELPSTFSGVDPRTAYTAADPRSASAHPESGHLHQQTDGLRVAVPMNSHVENISNVTSVDQPSPHSNDQPPAANNQDPNGNMNALLASALHSLFSTSGLLPQNSPIQNGGAATQSPTLHSPNQSFDPRDPRARGSAVSSSHDAAVSPPYHHISTHADSRGHRAHSPPAAEPRPHVREERPAPKPAKSGAFIHPSRLQVVDEHVRESVNPPRSHYDHEHKRDREPSYDRSSRGDGRFDHRYHSNSHSRIQPRHRGSPPRYEPPSRGDSNQRGYGHRRGSPRRGGSRREVDRRRW